MDNLRKKLHVYASWLHLMYAPLLLIANISDGSWGSAIFFVILDIIIIPRRLKYIYEYVNEKIDCI